MKPKLKPQTIKLLRQVKRKILAEPRQFQMGVFFSDFINTDRTIPNCGTAACIGGWAIALSKKLNPANADHFVYCESRAAAFDLARSTLGITIPQSIALFRADMWPQPFAKPPNVDFDSTDSPAHNAKLAARRIEHFIKTGK